MKHGVCSSHVPTSIASLHCSYIGISKLPGIFSGHVRFEQVTSPSSTGRAPAQRDHHLHPTVKTDNSRFLPSAISSKYIAVTFFLHCTHQPERFHSLTAQSRHKLCSQEVMMVLVSSKQFAQYREVVVWLARRQMMKRSSKYIAVTFFSHFTCIQEPELFNFLTAQSRHKSCLQEVVMVLVTSEQVSQYREGVLGLAQRQMMSKSAKASHSIIQNFELCILVTESSGKRAPRFMPMDSLREKHRSTPTETPCILACSMASSSTTTCTCMVNV